MVFCSFWSFFPLLADGESPDSALRFRAVAGGEAWLAAGGELEACEPCDEAILADRRAMLLTLITNGMI